MKTKKAKSIPTTEPSTRRRVLVISHDPAKLAAIAAELEADPGIDARTSAFGFDAGRVFERFRPELVLMDDRAPEWSPTCVSISGDHRETGAAVLLFEGDEEPGWYRDSVIGELGLEDRSEDVEG